MIDPKQKVLKIIQQIEDREIDPIKGWDEIKRLKEDYVSNLNEHHPKLKSAEQSWHSYLAIVDFNFEQLWDSSILAIISCKTSLRERIAQACYWKLKFLSSDVTKDIKVFLTTVDNDDDFIIDLTKKKRLNGKSRIIAEYELDGVYILCENFKSEWESSKIKRYERIFNDLLEMFKKSRR